MSRAPLLGTPETIRQLAERLGRYGFINKLDQSGEPEAWILASALSEIEEILRDILGKYLPDLLRAESSEESQDALVELLEAFRHALYHVREPRFFRDLVDD